MKVFYTDLQKKSSKTRLGFALLKLSVVFFIVFLFVLIFSYTIFETESLGIKIGFTISIIIMIIFILTFTCGLLIAKSKITGEEDLRAFLYYNENLYIIENNGIENDHFSLFRLSLSTGGDELSILLAIENMLSYNEERIKKISESRNANIIIDSLKKYKYKKIKHIDIKKDTGTSIDMIIRTEDDSRRKISVGDNYFNYVELFSIIRKLGGKR